MNGEGRAKGGGERQAEGKRAGRVVPDIQLRLLLLALW